MCINNINFAPVPICRWNMKSLNIRIRRRIYTFFFGSVEDSPVGTRTQPNHLSLFLLLAAVHLKLATIRELDQESVE